MSKYQRPVMILRPSSNEDGEDTWEGSARGYDKSALKDFRGFLLGLPYTEYAEGHNNAFGVGVKAENLDRWHQAIEEALKDFEFIPRYDVDFIYQASNTSEDIILSFLDSIVYTVIQVIFRAIFNLANFEMTWGKGVDKPFIVIENVKVNSDDIAFMGANKRTMKITLPNGIEMIKFNIKEEEKDMLEPGNGVLTLNVLGQCDRNEYNGRVTAQIKISDYEIMSRSKWNF